MARLFARTLLIALAMFLVGLFLTGVGLALMQVLGGGAKPTQGPGFLVLLTAFGVSDFVGASVVAYTSGASRARIVGCWLVVRLLLMSVLGIGIAVVGVQLAVAALAAWLGARAGLRRREAHRSPPDEPGAADAEGR